MKCFIKHNFLIFAALVLICIIILFDLFMAAFAFWEYNANWETKEEFLSGQIIKPDATPLNRSVILLHGFVGSPSDFQFLSEKISKKGFRVVVPAIPGQTKKTFAYRRGSYTYDIYYSWLKKIIKEETIRFDKKPYLIGFSMGGTLSSDIASKNTVDKLVLFAPFYSLPTANSLIWAISRKVKYIIPVVPKIWGGKINDPEGYKRYTPGSYIISLSAFDRVQEFAVLARNCADGISVPVLIVSSPNDQIASYREIRNIFRLKKNVKFLEYPRSNHILLYDFDQEEIVEKTLEFLSN